MAGGKYSKTKILLTQRRLMALELRRHGASYREIVEAIRNSKEPFARPTYSLGSAFHDVEKACKDMVRAFAEHANTVIGIELERLDVALKAVWKQVIKGELGAIHTMLKIMERRARLLSLDAPSKIDVTHYLEQAAIDEGLDPNLVLAEAQKLLQGRNETFG